MKPLPGMKQIPLPDRATFNLSFLLEHYFPKSDLVQRVKTKSRLRIAEQAQQQGKGKVVQVKRIRELPPKAFNRPFLSKGKERKRVEGGRGVSWQGGEGSGIVGVEMVGARLMMVDPDYDMVMGQCSAPLR